MKKVILCVLAAMSMGIANAQTMKAFKSLGIGVEGNILGGGIQLSMPLLTDHIVLNLGYNFGAGIKVNNVASIDQTEVNSGLTTLNDKMATASDPTGYQHFDYLTDDVDVNAKLKMGSNFKIMAELYPSKKSSFHFTVGALFGNGKIFTLSANADDVTQKIYDIAKYDQDLYNLRENGAAPGDAAYEDFILTNVRFNIDEDTYSLNGNDVSAKAHIKAGNVKPYFGIGFGRSIPKKRVGAQFEIGAWYHGKPKISSPNKITYDPTADGIDGVGDIMSKIQFFPQMTLRLTGRIL